MFVYPSTVAERKKLIAFLEANGFSFEKDKETVFGSKYPLSVDFSKKTVGVIGNTVCAAGAASAKALYTEQQFYDVFASLNNSDRGG